MFRHEASVKSLGNILFRSTLGFHPCGLLPGSPPKKGEVLPQFFPVPHRGGGLHGERESELMSQHANLSAMMRLVRNHVSTHRSSRAPRPRPAVSEKTGDAPWKTAERITDHFAAARCTLGEGRSCLLLRTSTAIQERWDLQMRSREPQPFTTNVVDVSKHRSDSSTSFAGRLGSPGAWIQLLQQELIYAVVQRIGLHHLLGEISRISAKGALRTCPLFSACQGMLLRFGGFHRLKMPPDSLSTNSGSVLSVS